MAKQKMNQPIDFNQQRHLATFEGYSYACSNVMSAFDNPYSSDLLYWVSKLEDKSEEAKNWIVNAQKCGWVAPSKDDNDGDLNERSSDSEDDDSEDKPDGLNHPTFLRQKRIMSTLDDNYIRDLISDEAYYELVGDPSPRFYDPALQMIFMAVITAICLGLLACFDIPYLLI